jgi:hypothetical protein
MINRINGFQFKVKRRIWVIEVYQNLAKFKKDREIN